MGNTVCSDIAVYSMMVDVSGFLRGRAANRTTGVRAQIIRLESPIWLDSSASVELGGNAPATQVQAGSESAICEVDSQHAVTCLGCKIATGRIVMEVAFMCIKFEANHPGRGKGGGGMRIAEKSEGVACGDQFITIFGHFREIRVCRQIGNGLPAPPGQQRSRRR